MNPQTLWAVAEAISCCPQPDGKAQLLKTTLGCVMEDREVKEIPNQQLHPHESVFMEMGSTPHATRGERQSLLSPDCKPVTDSSDLLTRFTGAIVA